MERAEPDQLDGAISEALKEQAMDEAPIGITLADATRPDNPLVYVNDSFVELTGYEREEILGHNCRFLQGPESSEAATAEMRAAIDAAEPVSVELRNYRRDGTVFWNKVDIAPIRDADGELTHFVGFQTDITDRKEAELAVERERANLEHLVDRINGLMREVTADLVTATTRADVDRALVEGVAGVDPYVGAAVATVDRPSGRVVAGARTGDAPDFEVALDGDDPVATAVQTAELQVTAVADLPADSPHRRTGVSLAVVPLTYRGTSYGVLAVYASEPETFDQRETVVLSALARAAATAANAVETRRMLTTDEVVELDVAVSDPDLFFVALSEGREFAYGGAVPRSDGTTLTFFTLRAGDPDAFLADAVDHPAVRSSNLLVERDDGAVVELAVETALLDLLADRGARLQDVAAVDGEARLRIELPAGGDPRGLVGALRERHPGTELVGYREHERPARTRESFVDALEDRLTERQLTALRKAYLSGYFDPERPVTGEELAASMDISRATFHQHLRAAERKLVAGVLDEG